MILEKIVNDTKLRIAGQKAAFSPHNIKKAAEDNTYKRISLKEALQKNDLAVIAEVKKGSPSKGLIAENFNYLQIARDYEAAGASAVSVLTEPTHFLGSNVYLTAIKNEITLPVLRKDFVIDDYQVYEAVAIGADAILLIAAILTQSQLAEYIKIAQAFAIDCLVEIHTVAEAEKALKAGAEIIGINNRDLTTFDVNFSTTFDLINYLPPDKLIVSESGISTNADIAALRAARVNAVLIGETLMRADDKKARLKALMSG
ncbi:MAG: indole-3-glycerol phosphate synthase TrpC [Clostridiales bacterium]|jgi:indole-3-glycerol phosphate synthase|nr:indole-3-glycerol phosphate synthase TrpC [Clostridiales bacterium]